MDEGEYLVLQNEINLIPEIIKEANEHKIITIVNPSPISKKMKLWPFRSIDYLILNEIEGRELTDKDGPEDILEYFRVKYPSMAVVLTIGEKGSYYQKGNFRIFQKAYETNAVDTTAAGDTFTGYFIMGIVTGKPIHYCMDLAAKASSLTVSRKGAASSIPQLSEVIEECI